MMFTVRLRIVLYRAVKKFVLCERRQIHTPRVQEIQNPENHLERFVSLDCMDELREDLRGYFL